MGVGGKGAEEGAHGKDGEARDGAHQLKPCLLVGVCFSSRAVSCSMDSFCSRFICSTDWQPIWSGAEAELGRWEFWKLGQRSFWGLESRLRHEEGKKEKKND